MSATPGRAKKAPGTILAAAGSLRAPRMNAGEWCLARWLGEVVHAYVPSHQGWKWCCDLVLEVDYAKRVIFGAWRALVGFPATSIKCRKILVFVGARYKHIREKLAPVGKSTHQYCPSLTPKESCTHPILPSKGLRSLLSLLSVPPRRVRGTPS